MSGRISRMKGGEFFRFSFGLWHSLTTLSMSFHVFSIVFLLISSLGGATLAENAPCRREKRYEKLFLVPVAILLTFLTQDDRTIQFTLLCVFTHSVSAAADLCWLLLMEKLLTAVHLAASPDTTQPQVRLCLSGSIQIYSFILLQLQPLQNIPSFTIS